MSDSDTYWARGEKDELAPALVEKKREFYRYIEETGRLSRWREATRVLRGYSATGGFGSSHHVTSGGEQGELARLRINHYAAIVQGIHTLITGSPPTTRAIAATAGKAGVDQAAIANKLLDSDRKTSGLERLLDRAALYALVSGEGWIYQGWDPNGGRAIGTEVDETTGEERLVYEGDISCEALHAIDVWRDPDVQLDAGRRFDWLGCRRRLNRWNLVSQFPQYRDEIIASGDGASIRDDTELFERNRGLTGKTKDKIYVDEWYHLPCPALPSGRYAWMVGDTIIAEGPYPYGMQLPLYEMFPDVQEDSCFGDTPMNNLLAPQAAYDSIASSALTNLRAFGVQNVWIKKGDSFDYDELSTGMNVLQTSTKPEPLQLTRISEDAYKMLSLFKESMELLSGANSVMRGDPQASLKSGAALALVQALAVQHNSGHQRSYASLVERVYTGRIKLWQSYVKVERTAEIIGDDETVAAQEWTGDAISGVSRVAVEMTNPVFSTSEGKKQLAEYLVANGMADRHEFLQVVETGRLDPILKREESQKRMILRENERLRDRKECLVLWTDRHRLHMREHAVLLDDPMIRFDDEAAAHIYQHITEHREMLFNTPIELLEAIGEPPPSGPPPGAQSSPPGPPGQPSGPPASSSDDSGPIKAPVPAVASGSPTGGPEAGLPNLPSLPQETALPGAGQQFDPTAPIA